MEIPIRISDPSGEPLHDVLLSADNEGSVADATEAIVEALGWPRRRADGGSISYCLLIPGRSRAIDGNVPLRELQVEPGMHFIVAPV